MNWTYLKVKFWLSARADLLVGSFTLCKLNSIFRKHHSWIFKFIWYLNSNNIQFIYRLKINSIKLYNRIKGFNWRRLVWNRCS